MQINQYSIANPENAYTDCPICWDSISSTDNQIRTRCNHLFHQACLNGWVRDHSDTCPFCRSVRPLLVHPEPSFKYGDLEIFQVISIIYALIWFPAGVLINYLIQGK
jgi:hypothetical protein